MAIPAAPEGYSTVNPFLITRNADGLMEFVAEVFGGTELTDARTVDHDGLLLHAELAVGDTVLMFADRKPGWPYLPSLLQIYVDDVSATLATAERLGARVVTRPTDFFGEVFSRFVDPWQNLWWVYRHASSTETETETETEADWSGDNTWSPTPELTYIHETLLSTMPTLRDPVVDA